MSPSASRASAALCISVFVVTGVFYTLCARWVPFYDKGEPREALVVRAILSGQGVLLPRSAGREVASKPPFFHWLAALAFTAGVEPDELACRLPSILLAAGALALTAAVTARWYGPGPGIAAAAVLGSSYEWLRAATQCRVDMTLAFLVVAAALAWHTALTGVRRPWAIRGGYLLVAAAVLTKGPVGLVLPLLIAASEAFAVREPRRLVRLLDPPGILAVLVLCSTWYAFAWRSGGENFLTRHVIHENVQRFLGSDDVIAHRKPPYYYSVALLGAYFPWILALPGAVWRAWRERAGTDNYLLVWFTVVIVFFSLASGKRSAYLLPAFPPLAMLTGRYLVSTFAGEPTLAVRRVLQVLTAAIAITVAFVVLGWEGWILKLLAPHLEGRDLAHAGAAVAILDANRWGVVTTLCAIGVGLVWLDGRRPSIGPWRAVVALCVVAGAWGAGLTAFGTYPLAQAITLRPFAAQVRAVVDDGDILWASGYVDYSFRYYVDRELRPWKERRGPSNRREFIVAPVTCVGPRLASHRLITRLIDLRPHARVVLKLYEVRGSRGDGRSLALTSPADPGMGLTDGTTEE